MQNVLNALYNLIGSYYKIEVICSDENAATKLNDKISVFHFRNKYDSYGVLYSAASVNYYGYIKDTDIMMSVGKMMPLSIGASSSKVLHDTPTIVRATEDVVNEYKIYGSFFKKTRKYIANNIAVVKSLHLADKIAAVGPNLASQIKEHNIEAKKIEEIPNPFNPEPFRKYRSYSGHEAKKRVGLDPNKKTVLFVGDTIWLKGIDRFAKVAKRVTSKTSNVQFCVVGDGPGGHILNHFADANLKHVGYVEPQTVPIFYAASDLLFYPTRSDALPNVILEAIASRLPILSTPVGEIGSYVSNIGTNVEDFVQFIMSNKWNHESPPEWFNRDILRDRYLAILDDTVAK